MQDNILDQYIHRLQNLEPFNIYAVDALGRVSPWYEVTGEIVRDLVIHPAALRVQVETISAQIQHWGRMAAQCKRVWEIEERDFRIWKAEEYVKLATNPGDSNWKKPSDTFIDSEIRTRPEYRDWYVRVERAEEAFNAAMAIVDGFRAKRDMLKAAVYRNGEDGAPKLSV